MRHTAEGYAAVELWGRDEKFEEIMDLAKRQRSPSPVCVVIPGCRMA
ncbi:MAG: hypothetical protein U0175_32705 [Caldilineaceae bacterium]